MLVLQVYDISISMNKHVCNFVLREGKKGGKKKKKKGRKNMLYLDGEYIYFTKGWKIAVPRNSTKDKKKKKRIKFVIRLEKKSCPFDDESDIEPNSV